MTDEKKKLCHEKDQPEFQRPESQKILIFQEYLFIESLKKLQNKLQIFRLL